MAPGTIEMRSHGEGTDLKVDQIPTKLHTAKFVYVVTVLSGLGGFLFGYDTGVISGAVLLVREEFILTSFWQELVVSSTIGAAAVFALLAGFIDDRIGRKPVIMISDVIFAVGALVSAFAADKYMLLGGRIVLGVGIGFVSCTVPMYIAEIAPAHARGRLVTADVIMIAGGQFFANIMSGTFSFYLDGWRIMLGIGAIPAVIQFIAFIFLPESPRWLIIHAKEDKAKKVLEKLRGHEDVGEEFEHMRQSILQDKQEMEARSHAPICIQMFKIPAVRRALIIGCSLQMLQQLAGINTVMYYSPIIIKMAGIKTDIIAIWLSSLTSFTNFVFTFAGLYLVEKIGRRVLTLGSLVGAIMSLAWLGVGFQLGAMNAPDITVWEKNPLDPNSTYTCHGYQTCHQCMKDLGCGFCYNEHHGHPKNGSCLPTTYDDPFQSFYGRCNSTHLPEETTWAYDYCPTKYYWMPMVGLVFYVVMFAPGMGPMPWTINSEIYPLWARSTGNSIATFTNWIFNLIVSITFLTLTEGLTQFGTFWLYCGFALAGFIFLLLFLPETKGKSLEEVEGVFARPFCGGGAPVKYSAKSVQYVHIRGLNRDGTRDSDTD